MKFINAASSNGCWLDSFGYSEIQRILYGATS